MSSHSGSFFHFMLAVGAANLDLPLPLGHPEFLATGRAGKIAVAPLAEKPATVAGHPLAEAHSLPEKSGIFPRPLVNIPGKGPVKGIKSQS